VGTVSLEMNITLNGKAHDAGAAQTIGELLESMGLGGRPVVIELDREALLPREQASAPLKEGSIVEVVQITAGG
jgi:sulfur carrier protein